MSSAVFPSNMRRQSGGGYSQHSRLESHAYVSWKGSGVDGSLPVGIACPHQRPLTNRDPTNDFPAPFGRPRPLKHYRRGRGPRVVASGTHPTAISDWMDRPGGVQIRSASDECTHCPGNRGPANLVWKTTLTERPALPGDPSCSTHSAASHARPRVLGANTVLSPSYFQTMESRRQHQGQTFAQQAFHFAPAPLSATTLPTPLTVAQCLCAQDGSFDGPQAGPQSGTCCPPVTYKPNNTPFSVQGGVESSAQLLRLRFNTLRMRRGPTA
jgi:hypothetical protein